MAELHEDSQCKSFLKEVEYDENALNIFFSRQYKFQKYMSEKRGTLSPPEKIEDVRNEHVLESIYHLHCFNQEYEEFYYSKDIIEKKFEIADLLHFLVNSLLYLGINNISNHTIDSLFNTEYSKSINYYFMLNNYMVKLINEYPYKNWKTYKYDEIKYDKIKINNMVSVILDAFIGLICNDISKEELYQYYISKNILNYKRQELPEFGYID